VSAEELKLFTYGGTAVRDIS